MPKFVGGGRPFPPNIFVQSDPPPVQTAKFRPISAHRASTVIASEKVQSALIGSRPRAFQRAIDEPCRLPLSPPKGGTKRDIAVCVNKIQRLSKKSLLQSFFVWKLPGYVVATLFSYPTVHRSIAGDVPIYPKLAFKVTHPFRKRRFPKLSFKSAIGLGAFWYCFSPYDTLAVRWHPQKILRRSSQGNPSVGGFKRKGVVIYSDFWHLECENSETC